jgi:hypothetical protein
MKKGLLDMNDRRPHTPPMTSSPASLSLRPAGPADATALDRLAALDSSRRPAAPVLLAFLDGRPAAALSLADGRAVADPFQRTAHALAVLRLRAGQERSAAAPRRRRRLARPARLALD